MMVSMNGKTTFSHKKARRHILQFPVTTDK